MTTDLLHAIGSWKQDEFVQAQAAVIRLALFNPYFYPGDIPESSAQDSRQGVASNAWNSLRALNIIERLPIERTIPARFIFHGRKRNTNPSAKGRWCAVYYLKSRSLAEAWLRRHGLAIVEPTTPKQTQLALTNG